MTMPHLMNCPHKCNSWCLSCVKELWEEREELARALHPPAPTGDMVLVVSDTDVNLSDDNQRLVVTTTLRWTAADTINNDTYKADTLRVPTPYPGDHAHTYVVYRPRHTDLYAPWSARKLW